MKKRMVVSLLLVTISSAFLIWLVRYTAPATSVLQKYEEELATYSLRLKNSVEETNEEKASDAREKAFRNFMDKIGRLVVKNNGALSLISENYKKYTSTYLSRANLPRYSYCEDLENLKEKSPETYETINSEIKKVVEDSYYCILLVTRLDPGEKVFEEYELSPRYYYFKKTFWGYKLDWIITMQDLIIRRLWTSGMDLV